MTNARLMVFSEQLSALEPSLPDASKIISGHPAQTVRNHYSDSSGQFFLACYLCRLFCKDRPGLFGRVGHGQ